MKKETADYLIERHNKLKTSFDTFWASHFQELADYIIPRKSNITVRREKGSKQTEKIFDSTAIHSNELLAASMQANLVPSSTRWFDLRARFPRIYNESGEDLNKNMAVRKYLDGCADEMFQTFNDSNFNTVIHEAFLDLGCFGTACISMEGMAGDGNSFEGFQFRALPIEEYVFAESTDGSVDAVFRIIKKTARQALQRWDKKDLHESILKAAKEDPEEEFDFLHAVFPRTDRDEKKKDKLNSQYASIFVDVKNKQIVEEAGYEEFPFMVVRWAKSAGERYGRGPGRTAWPDIRVLNKSKEIELKAWTKSIDPPVLVEHDMVLGTLKMTPNSMIMVRDINRRPVPFETGARWDISNLKKGELVDSIRKIFYSDQLQMQEGPQMTAREVMVRYELMQRLLGPTLGRIITELLNPLIERAFKKMERMNAFAEKPDILKSINQKIDIGYVGPLALAQKMQSIQAIDRWLETTLPLVQIEPGTLDVINLEKVAKHKAELLGVPGTVMRTEEEIMEVRSQRQAMQAQQMERENAMKEMEGLGKVAPFLQAADKATNVAGEAA